MNFTQTLTYRGLFYTISLVFFIFVQATIFCFAKETSIDDITKLNCDKNIAKLVFNFFSNHPVETLTSLENTFETLSLSSSNEKEKKNISERPQYVKKSESISVKSVLPSYFYQDFFMTNPQTYQVYPIEGLKLYFEEMSVAVQDRISHANSMKYEWVRVRSFWSFPSNIKVSPLKMARVGFYYTGRCLETRCFCCRTTYRNWKDGDDPFEIHQNISNNRCTYLLGIPSLNVPIHEEDRQKPRQHVENTYNDESFTVPVGLDNRNAQVPEVHTHNANSRNNGPNLNNNWSFLPMTQSTEQIHQCEQQGQQGGLNNLENNGAVADITAVNQNDNTNTNTGSSNLELPKNETPIESQLSASGHCQITNTQLPASKTSTESELAICEQSESTQSQIPEGELATGNSSSQSEQAQNPQTSTPETSSTGDQNITRSAQRPSVNSLGICFDKPKYFSYASLRKRENSYDEGWPAYLSDLTPIIMARAGFFFAGYGDYTRCFFCGGGLRNWEAGDDPLIEHARWFPRCMYLIQNTQPGYIDMVQTQHNLGVSQVRVGPVNNNFDKEVDPNNKWVKCAIEAVQKMTDDNEQDRNLVTHIFRVYLKINPTFTNADFSFNNYHAGNVFSIMEQYKKFPKVVEYLKVYTQQKMTDINEVGTGQMTSETLREIRSNEYRVFAYIQKNISDFKQFLNTNDPAISALTLDELLSCLRKYLSQSFDNFKKIIQFSTMANCDYLELFTDVMKYQEQCHPKQENALEGATGGQAEELFEKSDENIEVYTPDQIEGIFNEYYKLKERMVCVICKSEPIAISFLPCGHFTCCLDCAPAMRHCPICNELVRGTIKTYLP